MNKQLMSYVLLTIAPVIGLVLIVLLNLVICLKTGSLNWCSANLLH